MEDLKVIFASNLIRLRTDKGLTQAQLAEQLNYSDKSVSKWERGEALPDVLVVKAMADLFGVTVDFMLTSHDEWNVAPVKATVSTGTITAIVQLGIWTIAALLYIIFWLLGKHYAIIFVAALPVSLLTLLILNSVWNKKKGIVWIAIAFVLSVLVLIYLILETALQNYHPWQLFILSAPASAIVWLSFRIRRKATSKNDETR